MVPLGPGKPDKEDRGTERRWIEALFKTPPQSALILNLIEGFEMASKQGREHHIEATDVSPYTPFQLFSLVSDVERYREFVPWCKGSRIKETTTDGVVAELTVGYGPLQAAFTTRNRNQPGKSVKMELTEGPLEHMRGSWHFQQVKDGKTRVDLDLKFRFTDRRMDVPFGLVSKKAVKQMVRAFKERARTLYGRSDME